jgi:ribonuclease Y
VAVQIDVWLFIVIVLALPPAGAGVMWWLVQRFSTRSAAKATLEAERVVAAARAQADARAKTIELAAEKAATERRQALDREMQSALAEVKASQARAEKREEALDRKLAQIGDREQKLDARDQKLEVLERAAEELRAGLEADRAQLRDRLQQAARMTVEEARELFLAEVRRTSEHDAAALAQKIVEDAERDAREKARQVTLLAIQRYASENVSETTVRSVKIANEDVKGRIIGREGRNIRAIERATGADILVDDTPGIISVSCFDKVRSPPRRSSDWSPTAACTRRASRNWSRRSRATSTSASRRTARRRCWRPTSAACTRRSSRRWASCRSAPATARTCCATRWKWRSCAR